MAYPSHVAAKDLAAVERRGWLYVVRGVYVVVLGLMVSSVAGEVRWRDAASVGQDIFRLLVWGQFALTTALCSILTGDSIAGERRRGSLALLVVSFLKPSHIVAGKMMACVVAAGSTVLATVPLLMMTTLYGGVSGRQVAVASACLAAVLVGGTALGVLSSALVKRGGNAGGLTLALMIGWLWVAPAGLPRGPLREAAALLSPCASFSRVMRIRAGAQPPHPIVWALAGAGVLTALSFGWARRVVSRSASDRPAAAWLSGVRLHMALPRPWGCQRLFWDTSGLAGSIGPLVVLVYEAVVLLVFVVGVVSAGPAPASITPYCTGFLGVLTCAAAVVMLGVCMEAMMRQKADGTLGVLFCAPVSPARLVWAYLLGSARLLLPGVVGFEVMLLLAMSSKYWTAADWVGTSALLFVHAVAMVSWAVFYWLVGLKSAAF